MGYRCNKIVIVFSGVLLVFIMAVLFSCTNNGGNESSTLESITTETREIKEEEIVKSKSLNNGSLSEVNSDGDMMKTFSLGSLENKTIKYYAKDLEDDYNKYDAITIDIGDTNSIAYNFKELAAFENGDLIIKSPGVYVLKGELVTGQVRVEGNYGDRVEIVLDNARIMTSKDYAIYSPNDVDLMIRLSDFSDNYISSNPDDKNITILKSAIYSSNALCMTGRGSLSIGAGFINDIECMDVLTIMSGKYSLFAADGALHGESCVLIRNGEFNIVTGGESIKSTSPAKGFVFIEGGDINISSENGGIVSNNEIIFAGGNINVESKKECVKGRTIDVFDGKMFLSSSNDGIRATDINQNESFNQLGVYIRFVGGDTEIDSWNDGLDAKGNMIFEGGRVFISGPTRHADKILSYKGLVICKGGDLIALGASKEVMDLGFDPEQNYIIIYYSDKYARQKGSAYQLVDEAENILLSFTPEKDYRVAIISSDKLKIGNKYQLISREMVTEIVVAEKKTIIRQ